MNKKRAIILGAGPIGLVTGWQLLENGWSVVIYEKADIVGGMCRTWKWGEFLLDTGPHIYHTPDAKLAEFWEKEFGDLFIKDEFWCKNVNGDAFDQYWDYPLSWESIGRYPKELKGKILKELNECNQERMSTARNFTQYMEAQVGPTLRKMFFEKYPEKIWGISTDKMTPDWAPKRIEFRQKVTPFYHNQWNAVGKYGTGCIYERIKEKILALGGEINLNKTVTDLLHEGHLIEEVQFADNEKIKIHKDEVIISSLPITLTAFLLGYQSNLQFRGIHSVYLAYQKEYILPEGIHWLYYDSPKLLFNRITENKKLSKFVAPADKTYLTAEITYSKGDETDRMPLEELMTKVAEQVEHIGLAKKEDLIDCNHNCEPFVYPLQIKGYQEELANVNSVIASFSQVYSIGTGGDFNYADSQILFHKAFDTVSLLCNKDSAYTQVIRQAPRCKLNEKVNINGRNIGLGERAFIIAEAGMNHNGSVKMAKDLIDSAKSTGCDAIKFQTFQPKSRISRKIKAVKYAETIIGLEETIYDMFDRLAMDHAQQKEIFDYASSQGMEVFSTPFDFASVDFLESLNVSVYKISSMDIVNLSLIKHVAQTKKPIILSCGMSTFGQVEEAVDTIAATGNSNLMLLHCNSSYPASAHEMNLKVIQTLQNYYNIPVGLSDHTLGLFVSQIALTLGAQLIERHFTLDRTLEGPDHILSSESDEMSKLVSLSHNIPLVMGDGIKKIQPNEYATINTQRKCLYAACNIKKGDVITEEKISIKGPGGGLLPRYQDMVVGRIAQKDIEEDFPITWETI